MAAKTYRCSVQTTETASTVEGAATPVVSQDGRQRLVWSCDDAGRGVSVTISPMGAGTQFVLHGVYVDVLASRAGPDEP